MELNRFHGRFEWTSAGGESPWPSCPRAPTAPPGQFQLKKRYSARGGDPHRQWDVAGSLYSTTNMTYAPSHHQFVRRSPKAVIYWPCW